MKFKSLIVLFLTVSFFYACDLKEKDANVSVGNANEEQKFSYMLGVQFGRQAFRSIPPQVGFQLIEDYTIQGALDAVQMHRDTAAKLQLTSEALGNVSSKFAMVARQRMEAARPDSLAMATLEPMQLRQLADSLIKAAPIETSAPGAGHSVQVTENSSDNEKFSYMIGVEFGNQFVAVGEQFQVSLEKAYFKTGLLDGARINRDSLYVLALPEDTLKALGHRFNEKAKLLQEESKKKMQEEQQKLKEKVASLAGDTLEDGTPSKINYSIPMTGILNKVENLEPYANQAFFIFYYSTTCGHCQSAAPKLEAFASKYKKEGIKVLAIASGGNPKNAIRMFAEAAKVESMELLLDEERVFGELYGDGYVPKYYLVYPDGSYKRYPSFDQNLEEIEAELQKLLKK